MVDKPTGIPSREVKGATTAQPEESHPYVVRRGDTLSKIVAQPQHAGVTVTDIIAANPDRFDIKLLDGHFSWDPKDPDYIRPGETLIIPGPGQKSAPAGEKPRACPIGNEDEDTDKLQKAPPAPAKPAAKASTAAVQSALAAPSADSRPVDGKSTSADIKTQPASAANQTDLERRVTDLEDKLAQEQAARAADDKKRSDEAKRPGFFRTLMEIYDLFALIFSPLWNAACALYRLGVITYSAIAGKHKGETEWWKKQFVLLGTEAGAAALGIWLPGVGGYIGGAISASAHLYYNSKDNTSEIAAGAYNAVMDPKDGPNGATRHVDYGIRRAAEAVGSVLPAIGSTGKEPATALNKAVSDDDGVSPLTPAEVEV